MLHRSNRSDRHARSCRGCFCSETVTQTLDLNLNPKPYTSVEMHPGRLPVRAAYPKIKNPRMPCSCALLGSRQSLKIPIPPS